MGSSIRIGLRVRDVANFLTNLAKKKVLFHVSRFTFPNPILSIPFDNAIFRFWTQNSRVGACNLRGQLLGEGTFDEQTNKDERSSSAALKKSNESCERT